MHKVCFHWIKCLKAEVTLPHLQQPEVFSLHFMPVSETWWGLSYQQRDRQCLAKSLISHVCGNLKITGVLQSNSRNFPDGPDGNFSLTLQWKEDHFQRIVYVSERNNDLKAFCFSLMFCYYYKVTSKHGF